MGGTRYADENITLANKGIMHLFSNLKYEIDGQIIESINEPGIASVIMGLAKFPYDFTRGVGLMQCWRPETSNTAIGDRAFARRKEYILSKSDPKGSFSFIIELENQS